MKLVNPKTIANPASNYSHGVIVPADGNRLITSGQIGVNRDGSIAEGLHAQMQQCWENMFAILAEAGMIKKELVKIVAYVTQSGVTAEYRRMRDEMLDGHTPASIHLVMLGTCDS